MFIALSGSIGLVCVLYAVYSHFYTAVNVEGYTFLDYQRFVELPQATKDVLSSSYIEKEWSTHGNLSSLYDPRRVPALWLRYVGANVERGKRLDEVTIPFKWSDVLELSDIFGSCKSFFDQHHIEVPENTTIDSYCSEEGEQLRILRPIQKRMPEEARAVIGLNFLKHSAAIPEKIVFTSGKGVTTFNVYEGSIHEDFAYENDIISLHNESVKFENLISDQEIGTFTESSNSHVLEKKDFETDAAFHTAPQSEYKFFFEAILDTGVGEHFDWRFFRKFHHTDYERQAALQRIARAWLRFTNKCGITTWLAHGSLLGWFWNGMSMPWDNDLDVQLTMESLQFLGNHFNNSLVIDLIDGATSSYLVEVNPSSIYRETANRTNAIDARFIDTQTGFYIDITALTLTSKASGIDVADFSSQAEFNQLLDPEFANKKESSTITPNELKRDLISTRDQLLETDQFVNCKDNHFYKLSELELKQTMFEGVQAFIPIDYEKLLKREYNKALYNRIYNNYLFRSALWIWVPIGTCKNDWIGLECQDEHTRSYREATKKLTETHKLNLYKKVQDFREHEPTFVDPWMLERSNNFPLIF